MLDILSYGIVCVVVSALLAAIISCLLLFLSAKKSKRSNLSIVSLLSGAVLFLILTYQFSNIFGAVECKSMVVSIFDNVEMAVEASSHPAASAMIDGITEKYPAVGAFINSDSISLFGDSAHSLREYLIGGINDFILKRIFWSVVSLLILGILTQVGGSQVAMRTSSRKRRVAASHRYYREDFN